jgi:hypothetical protein
MRASALWNPLLGTPRPLAADSDSFLEWDLGSEAARPNRIDEPCALGQLVPGLPANRKLLLGNCRIGDCR